MKPRDLFATAGRRAALAVALITVGAACRLVGVGLHVDDVSYLAGLEAIAQGLEAPRPMRHLSWGLIHTVGHLPAPGSSAAWARGELGTLPSLLALLLIPATSATTWVVGRRLGLSEVASALAAVFAALAPTTLLAASMVGALPRHVGVGFTLLALALGPGTNPRRSLAPVVLFGLGLAWHPATIGMLGALALVWGGVAAASPPTERVFRVRSAVITWGLCAALAAGVVVVSGQGGMAGVGASSLAGVWVEPAVGLAHLAWQLPGLGGLLPRAAPIASVALGAVIVVSLLVGGAGRRLGLLALGAAVAMVTEAAALGFTPELAAAWTTNHVEAGLAVAVAGALVLGFALERVPIGRARSTATVVLVLAAVLRGGLLLGDHRATADADAHAQRLFGYVLLGSSSGGGASPTLVGPVGRLSEPIRALKWIAEVPESRRHLRRPEPSEERVAAYEPTRGPSRFKPAGVDYALWVQSIIRCELRLGVEHDLEGPCRVPLFFADSEAWTQGVPCWLDLRPEPPVAQCDEGPVAAGSGATRDPRAVWWALAALATLLGAALVVRRVGARAAPLLVLLGAMLAGSAPSDARAERIGIPLGDGEVAVEMHRGAVGPGRLIVLHGDELTAAAAAVRFVDEYGGSAALIDSTTRTLTFSAEGVRWLVDPNRVFSDDGVRASLRKYNKGITDSQVERLVPMVRAVGEELVSLALGPRPRIVAVHSNTPGGWSVEAFAADPACEHDPDRLGPRDNPARRAGHSSDDFVLVNQLADFDALAGRWNVVLHKLEGLDDADDGSLSVRASRDRMAYVNVEVGAPKGEVDSAAVARAVEMLVAVHGLDATNAPTHGPAPEHLSAFLQQWQEAWEANSRSGDAYAALYGEGFRAEYKGAAGASRDAWLADKAAKAARTACIDLELSDVRVESTGEGTAVLSFEQRYVSESWCDVGRKTLVLQSRVGTWLIVGEEQPAAQRCDERCR